MKEQNWEPQNSDTTEGLYSIQFADNNTGWMCGGSGLILYTTDGGSNWIVQPTGTNQQIDFISFPDANNGWVVGGQGTILYTSNGGVTFIEEESGEAPIDFLIYRIIQTHLIPAQKSNSLFLKQHL